MRIVNQKKETITEYDLTKGCLCTRKIIRPDAVPLGTELTFEKDGKTFMEKKRVWADEDYEKVQMYIPNPAPAPPSKLDVIEAQVAYTAMMTDTLLEV